MPLLFTYINPPPLAHYSTLLSFHTLSLRFLIQMTNDSVNGQNWRSFAQLVWGKTFAGLDVIELTGFIENTWGGGGV